jgi:hypothetical protein
MCRCAVAGVAIQVEDVTIVGGIVEGGNVRRNNFLLNLLLLLKYAGTSGLAWSHPWSSGTSCADFFNWKTVKS